MKTIVLVTSQVAPFQVELAAAVNEIDNVRYHVIFTSKENKRPPHWLDLGDKIAAFSSIVPHSCTGDATAKAWAVAELSKLNPDVVLIGGIRNLPYDIGQDFRTQSKVPIGLWMEPPLRQTSILHRAARRIDYKRRMRKIDFALAIGDRAHAYYRGCNANTHFVPYGSDLSACMELPLPKPKGDKTKFVFSGGLVERHNFPVIMEGFTQLLAQRGPCFEFIVSGDGPEQAVIDTAISKTPALGSLIRYERVFSKWTQRLNPFCEAHVFVYPTNHAGWGLVVPEAMAAGNLVISTMGAESARYLITPEHDGLIIEPNVKSFTDCLLRCVDDRQWVEDMGLAARKSSMRCDGDYVAAQLINTLRIATGGKV